MTYSALPLRNGAISLGISTLCTATITAYATAEPTNKCSARAYSGLSLNRYEYTIMVRTAATQIPIGPFSVSARFCMGSALS